MNYQDTIAQVKAAVSAESGARNKWASAAHAVAAYYKTKDALAEAKAQFCADAIIPALSKEHQTALAKELPRKGSEDYEVLSKAQKAAWEKDNTAKKNARATVLTMFNRVVAYAFPPKKKEAAPRQLKTRVAEDVAKLIKACQGAEDPGFDVAKVIIGLQMALAAAAK